MTFSHMYLESVLGQEPWQNVEAFSIFYLQPEGGLQPVAYRSARQYIFEHV